MITSDLVGPRRLGATGAVVLVLIVVVGCGGSSSTTKTTATTNATSEPATTTTAPATNPADDERIAREAQLKLGDFPSGWEQKDSAKETKSQAKCSGVDAAKAAASARQSSPDFAKGSSGRPRASSVVYIYADVPSATRAFGELSGESTRTCLADELGKLIPGETTGAVEVGKVTSGHTCRCSQLVTSGRSAGSRFRLRQAASTST